MNNYEKEASKIILGNYLTNMLDEYFDIIIKKQENNETYVVFTSEKELNLFMLYINENNEYKSKLGNNTHFITANALIDFGKYFGNIIKENYHSMNKIPNIIVLNSLLDHGTDINALLDTFKGIVFLKEINLKSFDEATQNSMTQCFSKVHCEFLLEYDKAKLILPVYTNNSFTKHKSNDSIINSMDRDFDELLWNLGYTSHNIIDGVVVEDKLLNNKNWSSREWQYRGHNTKYYFSRSNNFQSGVKSINKYGESRNILIPFVILPKINKNELEILEENIYNELFNYNIIETNYNDIKSSLDEEVSLDTRLYFIISILELSVLNEFDSKIIPDNKDTLLNKSSYYFLNILKVNFNNILNNVIKNPKCLQSISDLDKLFTEDTSIKNNTNYNKDYSIEEKEKINTLVEFFLFEKILTPLDFSHKIRSARYRPGDNTLNAVYTKYFQKFQEMYLDFVNYAKNHNFGNVNYDKDFKTFIMAIKEISDYGSIRFMNCNILYNSSELSPIIMYKSQIIKLLSKIYYLDADFIRDLERFTWIRGPRRKAFINYYIDNIIQKLTDLDKQYFLYFIEKFLASKEKITNWGMLSKNYRTIGGSLEEVEDYSKLREERDARREKYRKILNK